ncbi:MAG: hypothetical protein IPO66_13735 [Rhodanobacteraceae bacterium]|nr:hypothetical protein [Rhodanobacteraceae bacterium]
MDSSQRWAGLSGKDGKPPPRVLGIALECLLAALSGGCDSQDDAARREYFKALELSKTGFPEEQQLAHIDHAGKFAGNHALAAVLLMEGRFNEALGLLDELIATADSAHSGLPKTLRLLVHAAMDRPDLVTAEFDAQSLAAAEHWPEMGYRYWFVVRNCSNAFFTSTAGEVLAKAQGILAASAPAH